MCSGTMEVSTNLLHARKSQQSRSTVVTLREILRVDMMVPDGVQIKSKYCFKIEMKDRIHLFGIQTAKEINTWMRIIKRSRRTYDEVMRTEDKKVRKNIDKLVWLFRYKKGDEINAFLKEEFDIICMAIRVDRTKPESFVKFVRLGQLNCFDVGFRVSPVVPGCYSSSSTFLRRLVPHSDGVQPQTMDRFGEGVLQQAFQGTRSISVC